MNVKKNKVIQSCYFFLLAVLIYFVCINFCFASNTNIINCKDLKYNKANFLNSKNFQTFHIELQILNQKKWKNSLINNLIELKKNDYVVKNKISVKARLIIGLNDSIKCSAIAKIKPHGDYYDHYVELFEDGTINLAKGYKLPSLRVRLLDTHIFGITNFILLKPITRNYDNEVFIATLYENLGLLSPKSANIQVSYNNDNYKFIFQEKITKEFIENNNLQESAIYSGDERIIFDSKLYDGSNKFISLHKLDNKKWIKSNKKNLYISNEGLNILNFSSFLHENDNIKSPVDYYTSNKESKFDGFFNEFPVYDALATVVNSKHGLSKKDRRMYYDFEKKIFVPIYYDQNSNILDIDSPSLKENILENNIIILNSALKGSAKIKNLIEKLDLKTFIKTLNERGLLISLSRTKKILDKINKNLKTLINIQNNNISFSYNKDLNLDHFLEKISLAQKFNENILYVFEKNENFSICNFLLQICQETKFDISQITDLYNQDLIVKDKESFLNFDKKESQKLKINNNNILIYLGKYENFFNNTNNKISMKNYNVNNFYNYEIYNIDKDTKLKIYGEVKFYINDINRKINFTKYNKNSAVIFSGGNLENWTINFKDLSNNSGIGEEHILGHGLSGCLNFKDIKLEKINFYIYNSKCEDGINLIRVKGNILNMIINNSFSDAMDADFSTLHLDYLNVSSAKNDCVDFSYGSYNIKNIKLFDCDDKGISIGENSTFFSKTVLIENTNIGIASKDSSIANFKKLNINNTNTCLSAYKKKQEFSGSLIVLDNFLCNNFNKKYLFDNISKINF